jgi:uncharacterized protein YdhG (YjbR/CyaY superfamily)
MAEDGFSDEERAAMKERAAELRKSSRGGSAAKKAAADLQDVLDKIAEMDEDDRVIAETLHSIVMTRQPALAPRTWYGMPAYAKAGKVIVFFKARSKFGTRYAEVGFNEFAGLDEGDMWPTAYAVTAMTPDIEAKLAALVVRAAG